MPATHRRLQVKQRPLERQATQISGQLAVGANRAVAGHDDRDRGATNGGTLGPSGGIGRCAAPALESSCHGTLVTIIPGSAGGATWGSSAVEPNRGLMFVVSKERPAIIKLNLPGEKSRGQTLGPPPLKGPLVTELGEFPRYDSPYDCMVMTNGLTTIGPP